MFRFNFVASIVFSVLCFMFLGANNALASDPTYKFTPKGLVRYTDSSSLVIVKPEIIFKSKYEVTTNEGFSRFTVRNSRIGLNGNLNSYIGYNFLLELSSEGKFNVLNLYVRFKPFNGFQLTFGQCPITVFNSYTISPSALDYANRPFLGKYLLSTRDIGLNATYTFNRTSFPIALEAGLYNGDGINNPSWGKSIAYGSRIIFGDMKKGFRSSVKMFKNRISEEENFITYGLDFRYKAKSFKLETELMSKYNLYDDSYLTGAYFQGLYSFAINKKTFYRIEPVLRWDAMGYDFFDSGFGVNRLTSGVNFVFNTKPFTSLFRVNYEHYFNKKGVTLTEFKTDVINASKFTLEVVLYF